MEEREIKKKIKKALSLIREHNTLDALFYLDKVIDLTDAPEVLSSYALCTALERGKVKDGIDMCIKAIDRDPENPFHYLNLGKIYLKDNKKILAIDVFRKGMKHDPANEFSLQIVEMLNILGIRRRPVVPFMDRDNIINKYLGLILSRLGLR